ncbi:hypothetical protein D3C87_1694140 [compost metagenome]
MMTGMMLVIFRHCTTVTKAISTTKPTLKSAIMGRIVSNNAIWNSSSLADSCICSNCRDIKFRM